MFTLTWTTEHTHACTQKSTYLPVYQLLRKYLFPFNSYKKSLRPTYFFFYYLFFCVRFFLYYLRFLCGERPTMTNHVTKLAELFVSRLFSAQLAVESLGLSLVFQVRLVLVVNPYLFLVEFFARDFFEFLMWCSCWNTFFVFFSPLYPRSAGTYTTMPNYYNTTGSPDSLVTQQAQLWTNSGE